MNSIIIGSFLRLGVYLFLFPFGKCFQAFPEVTCFLVSHSPSLPPLIFTNISPTLVLSSGLVFIIQGVSWASGYKQQHHVCVCFVSSPDYLQMSLLMSSRWFLSHFTEPASDKPPGMLTETVWWSYAPYAACSHSSKHPCCHLCLKWPCLANFYLSFKCLSRHHFLQGAPYPSRLD